jgi:rubrerythrin
MLGGLAGSVAFFMIAMVLLKYRNEMSVLQQQAQAPAGMPYGNPNMQYQQGGYAQPQMQMTVCQVCGLQYDNRLDKCPQCGTVNSNKQN